MVEDQVGCDAPARTLITKEAGWLLTKMSTLHEVMKRVVLRFRACHSPPFLYSDGGQWKESRALPQVRLPADHK